jgi:hypothetical protein
LNTAALIGQSLDPLLRKYPPLMTGCGVQLVINNFLAEISASTLRVNQKWYYTDKALLAGNIGEDKRLQGNHETLGVFMPNDTRKISCKT